MNDITRIILYWPKDKIEKATILQALSNTTHSPKALLFETHIKAREHAEKYLDTSLDWTIVTLYHNHKVKNNKDTIKRYTL